MAVTVANPLDALISELTCPVCLEIFDNPKVLVCHHPVCYGCLEKLVTHSNTSNGVILCPECRTPTHVSEDGVKELPVAFHINRLKDMYKVDYLIIRYQCPGYCLVLFLT